MTIEALYQQGKKFLGTGAVESYSLYALLMVYEGLASISDVMVHLHQNAQQPEKFYLGLNRLIKGEPLAYIINQTTFFGLTLSITPAVLIPRQETEELVQHILDQFPLEPSMTVIDVGTGSGAIALAIKFHRPRWRVIGTDIDHAALAVAKKNGKTLNLPIEWFHGDGLKPFLKDSLLKVNIIVSNPPYIDSVEKIDPLVRQYEPLHALFASPGTTFYRQYLLEAKSLLAPQAMFAFEIDPTLVITLPAIVKSIYPHATIKFVKDINHKDRFAFVYNYERKGTRS
jgi:release factor glutamine methyltransferase